MLRCRTWQRRCAGFMGARRHREGNYISPAFSTRNLAGALLLPRKLTIMRIAFGRVVNPRIEKRLEERYQRTEVLRIVGISARQLSGWEKTGLVSSSESYSFSDLVQLTKLRDLRQRQVPARVIRRTLAACSAAGMMNPLVETSMIFTTPGRIAVKHEGAAVDPVNGQFIFDFANPDFANPDFAQLEPARQNMRVVPIKSDQETVAAMFIKGVQLEESPETMKQAVEVYQQLLSIQPNHAPAHINLGTIFYNQQNFVAAENSYRKAVESDPKYALAYFDLGNVLDETGRLLEAIAAYEQALELAPHYADAHYNVALSYERMKQPRKALAHWQIYVKLDPVGPWANHARVQVERIVHMDQLKIVWRRNG